MKYKLLTFTFTLILSLLFATPVFAQGPTGDQVVFGSNLNLEAEEKIEGDVIVFGGNVTIPASAEINGDLVVFGGNADIDGTVDGDIGMIGGNIDIGETAVVKGDIGLLGGEPQVAEGARIEGNIQTLHRFGFNRGGEDEREDDEEEGAPYASPVVPATPRPPIPPEPPWGPEFRQSSDFGGVGLFIRFVKDVVATITSLLALAGISWLVASFMPDQMKVVGDTIAESTLISFGIGLLTLIIAFVLGGLLFITICLAFIPILGGLLLGVAMLFGWIVIGQMIGERLLIASGQPFPHFVLSTVLGVVVLTIITTVPLIGQIPCLGFILSLIGGLLGWIVALTGLGAVILTRFGTQPYQPGPGSSGIGPSPSPNPTGPDEWTERRPFSSLERAEAELRAKIKAALAEVDEAPKTAEETAPPETPAGEEPAPKKPATPEPPAPDNPPTGEKPADSPESDPKTDR